MIKCPKCGHIMRKNPDNAKAGQKGGKAKVAKGFASAEVMRKALATRKKNQEAKQQEQSK